MSNGIKAQATGRKDIFMIAPNLIEAEEGFNVRHDSPALREHLATLKESIRVQGILEPITVRPQGDRILIVNGHCRMSQVRELIAEGVEIRAIPCRSIERHCSEADSVLEMVTRNSGLPLSPLEKGEVFKRLVGYGWDAAEIASKAGCTATHVRTLLEIQAAPQEVLDLVEAGLIAASTVPTVVKLGNASEIKKKTSNQELLGKSPKSVLKEIRGILASPGVSDAELVAEIRDLVS